MAILLDTTENMQYKIQTKTYNCDSAHVKFKITILFEYAYHKLSVLKESSA